MEKQPRRETEADHEAVDEILRLAFEGEEEVEIVNKLRGEIDPELLLVIEEDQRVIGQITFSPVRIGQRDVAAVGLGPVAVLPALQRSGFGSKLILFGLERCRQLGHQIVVLLGHPEYYPRFGFERASLYGLFLPIEVPDESFMALELASGALEAVSGVVDYHPAFGLPPS